MSDQYFKWSYRFSHTEIENLIQCIGPHFVIPTTEKNSTEWSHSYGDRTPCINSLLCSGSLYNIFPLFSIVHTSFFRWVWAIVNAINKTPDMRIEFPIDHIKQQQIAHGFMQKSTPQFNCCVGCIDGMLIWTEKLNQHNCVMKCGPMHFMCGWKGKYGLNLQGVCNHIQRFTSIWILHPGSSSDFYLISDPLYAEVYRFLGTCTQDW